MRKLLFLLLIVPTISYSQSKESISAFQKTISTEFGEPIHLPDLGVGYDPEFDIDKIAGNEAKQRVLVVVSDSLYKKIFSRYNFTSDSLKASKRDPSDWYYKWMVKHLVDSLPVIDFTKKELVMYSACGQCLAFCDHQNGRTSCHRNSCTFMVAWFVREKMVLDEKKQFGPVNRSGS